MIMLSANQRYRQSGTSLSFAEWIEREKAKDVVIPQKGITDVYMNAVKEIETKVEDKPEGGNTVVGLNKNILILSGLIILGAITYNYFRGRK
jgi:hypothetical protein